MRKHGNYRVTIIKPVWWRQVCFTLFLLVIASFCSLVSRFGLVFSWGGTMIMLVLSLLSLLDQLFSWSRLKIDREGFSLRGWLRNQKFSHHEVEDFQVHEFAGKKLLVVELKEAARKLRNLPNQPVPFPCCFGRPIDEVLKIVRSKIDRTPRPKS